jgi:hypothetical protein
MRYKALIERRSLEDNTTGTNRQLFTYHHHLKTTAQQIEELEARGKTAEVRCNNSRSTSNGCKFLEMSLIRRARKKPG